LHCTYETVVQTGTNKAAREMVERRAETRDGISDIGCCKDAARTTENKNQSWKDI